MKRKWLAVGIILLFIGTAIIPSTAQYLEKTSPPTRGNWLYVGGTGPGNYSTIQGAVNAAHSGDTVFVYAHSSPYYENIIVYPSINLIGEDKNTTIIDGQHTGTVLKINTNYCRVSGFSILNCHPSQSKFEYAVIKIYKNGNIIENNRVSGGEMDYGIEWGAIDLARNSNNNTIIHNQFIYNPWGWDGIVTETGSNYNIISENNITDQDYGISIQYNSNHSVISGNTILANTNAIEVHGSYTSILNNTIKNNQWGIDCNYGGDHCTISYNIIQNNEHYGIELEDTDINSPITTYFIVSHNKISDNIGNGLAIEGIAYNTVEFNTFTHNSNYGLFISASAGTSIHYNNFMDKSKKNAYFEQNSNHNNWNNNYWGNSLSHGTYPTIIHGKRLFGFFFSYPWFNIDWSPAQKPFDIGG